MKTIHFSDDYEMQVQGSPWALHLYQNEFAVDGVKADFYGDLENYFACYEEHKPVDVIFLLKIAWAMGKNADDDLPNYEDWLRDLDVSACATEPWIDEISGAMMGELFRPRMANGEKSKPKRTTKRQTDSRKANPSS